MCVRQALTLGEQVEGGLAVADGTASPPTEAIGLDAAAAVARRAVPDTTVVTESIPEESDPTATYDIWLSTRLDPYALTDYPGDVEMVVDQRTGAAEVDFGRPDASVAQRIWEAWNYPVHSGYDVSGWWPILWFVAGMLLPQA